MIFWTKKDIEVYVASSPEVAEMREIYNESEPGGFKKVEQELVRLIATEEGSPDFGEDWTMWLKENLEELLGEAISIVM